MAGNLSLRLSWGTRVMVAFLALALFVFVLVPGYLYARPSWRSAWDISSVYIALAVIAALVDVQMGTFSRDALVNVAFAERIAVAVVVNLTATWLGFRFPLRRRDPTAEVQF